jgi:hypothetical protein
MKVIEFVKLNEIEIKNELIKLDLIDEDDIDELNIIENVNDEKICGGEDMGFDFSFKKSKLKEWVEEDNIIKFKINNKVLYCCYYSF